MPIICIIMVILSVLIIFIYVMSRAKRETFERRMSTSVGKVNRFFGDTSRRLSQLHFTSLPTTLKRRLSQESGKIGPYLSGKFSFSHASKSTEPQTEDLDAHQTVITSKEENQQLSIGVLEETDSESTVVRTTRLEAGPTADESTLDTDRCIQDPGTNQSLTNTQEDQDCKQPQYWHKPSQNLPALAEVSDENHPGSSQTNQMFDANNEIGVKETVPLACIVPTIKLDACLAEESTDQMSIAVHSASNEEVISQVSTYNTVSPRRVSLKPGNVPFRQLTPKRGSVMLSPTTVSPAERRPSLIVQPQGYVCPRRTSVLFASDIFAHSPRRKASTCGRFLHIPDTSPTKTSRFFLPRKSIIKNVIRSSWSAVTGHTNGGSGLRSGIRATTSCTGSYYPNRRRSSVGFSNDLNVSGGSTDIGNKFPGPTQTGGSLPRRKSVLKKMVKVQGEAFVESSKDDAPQKRRESRAGLSFFRRQSMFGRRQSTHIPKQKGNYLTGNLTEFKTAFGPNAHEVLTEKFRNHGPLYEITALGQRTVFLFDHRDIEQVKKAEGKYPKHMDFKHLRLYRQRNDLPLGMLLSNGEEWKQQRRVLSKMFLGAMAVARYVPVINKVATGIIEIISKNLPDDGILLPEEDIGNYVIEAFGRVLYGRDLHCLEKGQPNELHQFVKTAKSNFNDAKKLLILPTCLMLLHPAWRRQNERWNSLLETTVDLVRQSTDPGQKRNAFSIISQIFSSGELTEPEILVNLTDLLLASIDTTSTVILWCLYELSRHPEVQEKIVEEFKHCGHNNSSIKFQDFKELTYLKAVIKETLRLHPVGFLTCRTIAKPMFVRQYNVPQKSTVAAAMYVMGRNSELTSDPDSFIPERWLKDDPALEGFYNAVPFGYGPRACLGRRIAEIEISLFILHFCCKFQFRMKKAETVEHVIKLLLVPDKTLELSLERRVPCDF